MNTETAIFAAGCFWGVESDFRNINGVTNVTVGYTGGFTDNPSYYDVCSGHTNHAESVLVEFDPSVVSYRELTDVFFKIHNPTTMNRQGWDRGTQYRSAIFYNSDDQKMAAVDAVERNQANWKKPIVTEITQASTFFPAEEYHQRYYEKHGIASCGI